MQKSSLTNQGVLNKKDALHCLVSLLGLVLLVGGIIFGLAFCGSPPANSSQADEAWLARMGDRVVTVREFQNYLEQQCRRNPKLPTTPAQKRKLLETYLEKEMLLQEAARLELNRDPQVQEELKEARQQILLKHLFDRQAREIEKHLAVGEDEINGYYQDLGQEIRFRYLPVEDPAKAAKIIASWNDNKVPPEALDSGVVRLSSLCEEWKKQIGELTMMKPTVVKLGSEWFVIQVVSRAKASEKPLNECRERIVKELSDRKKQEMMQNWITGLKTKNAMEINPGYSWR
ncbi:MAG: SurA N-terminal domain-containing protein [Deltaproteobacteria bacterium]|nr:SurA N-terminal domain-containing protein [Deltaproteobacteria bacterium]